MLLDLIRSARIRAILLATLLLPLGAGLTTAHAQALPQFTKIIVFGDSLSDDGNVHHITESQYDIGYPGGDFNYSDGRFTNSSDTDPSSDTYVGVWHEQLARTFLNLPVATNSLDGGSDYAFGGATTKDGTSDRTVISNPDPFIGGSISITIDNIGRQIDHYLAEQTIDPNALYVVWGGGNDLFDDSSSTNVAATSDRVVALVNRLITAGAKSIMIPNVPPLGAIPHYSDDEARQAALDHASSDYRQVLNNDLNANVIAAPSGAPPTLYRLDVWSLFVRFAANPAIYGFDNIVDSAQGRSSADPDKYLFWDDIHPTTAGHFRLAEAANRVLTEVTAPTALALNVSARVHVGTGENAAVGGFIVTGSAPKKVVLRGIGPSLTDRGVPGALSDPTLTLFDANGAPIATNDNWQTTNGGELPPADLQPTDPLESAIVATLAPGSYTVTLSGAGGATGIGLVEIYDVDPNPAVSDSALANLSTRGFVGIDDDILIGGLIVGQGADPLFVIRAIGPDLANRGIANPLLDPVLAVFDSNGNQIGLNDNWQDSQPSAIKATLLAPADTREAAIVLSLAPGNYTAVVRGKNNTTGVALVEAYRVP